jgi:hypothetical protein
MLFGEFPYFPYEAIRSKRESRQAKKGDDVIQERTITLTVYNVYCDHCGARGPDGISEVDAHIVARQVGWEIIGDSYVCPDLSHAELKRMCELLVEIKDKHDSPALLTWWR